MIRLTWRQLAAACTYSSLVALAVGATACNGTDDSALPPNIVDPTSLKTPAGALGRYRAVRGLLNTGLNYVVAVDGLMTDQLAALPTPFGSIAPYSGVDSRSYFEDLNYGWPRLHKLRGQAREGRGFLDAYLPDSSTALQGLLYAYEGYADIYLADLFCSGIPLSTVNFDGSYTVAPGSTTDEVYETAVALFDSALAISSDSESVQLAAAVGKGRALLGLGRYADAAAAVANVPDGFARYSVYTHGTFYGLNASTVPDTMGTLWAWGADVYRQSSGIPAVADNEGVNGLDYRSSGDPRSSYAKLDGTDPRGNTMYFPAKYTADIAPGIPGLPRFIMDKDSFLVASGIEARLIEAEAALQGGGDWLGILNHLRQTMWTTIVADTVSDPWTPGPLPDLTDPGTASGRVDLVFRERAMWLFLTGHRQGDLRRLIRQYHRLPNTVYPTGPYTGGGGIANYGQEIVIPVPEQEMKVNPKYTGCFNGEA